LTKYYEKLDNNNKNEINKRIKNMLLNYFIAMGGIMLLLLFWVVIQHFARLYAAKHPEFGATREEGSGCGSTCICSNKEKGNCQNN
jgi:hypothetical protein